MSGRNGARYSQPASDECIDTSTIHWHLAIFAVPATTKLTKYLAEKIDIHNMILDCGYIGVEFLHTKARITHLDIKCGNIIMFPRGQPHRSCKLGDLGICTVIKDSKKKAGVYKPFLPTRRGWHPNYIKSNTKYHSHTR